MLFIPATGSDPQKERLHSVFEERFQNLKKKPEPNSGEEPAFVFEESYHVDFLLPKRRMKSPEV